MPIEIERRFLVDPFKLTIPKAISNIRQGYLSVEPVVRLRIIGEAPYGEALLTIKGPGTVERPEFEYKIPPEDAEAMWPLVQRSLEKRRHLYPTDDPARHWVVDEFLGPLEGLWLAEIELGSADEAFDRPDWLGSEVTEDKRYTNAWLAEYGLLGAATAPSKLRTDEEILALNDLTKLRSEERSRYNEIMEQRARNARLCDGPIGNTD